MFQDLEKRIARLEHISENKTLSKRSSFLRWAGSGLKAIHAVFPQTMGSNKIAQKILEILSSAIYDGGLDGVKTLKDIKGVAFLEADLSVDPQDQLEDEEIDATVGAVLSGTLQVEMQFMVEIKNLLKVRTLQIELDDRKSVSDLCDALTKNIAMSVIPRMSDADLIEHFEVGEYFQSEKRYINDFAVEKVELAYPPEIKVQRASRKNGTLVFSLIETVEGVFTLSEDGVDQYDY